MPILSIIILSYNTKSLTSECLQSLLRHYKSYMEKGEVEVIVFDNASSDGTIKVLKEMFGDSTGVTIVAHGENTGFSKGNNIAVEYAKGTYILFLNSDTEVVDDSFFSMVKFMKENEQIGILGGKLVNPDGSIQVSAGKFYSLFNTVLMLLGAERFGALRYSPSQQMQVDWVSGACMMVRRDVFQKFHGFDDTIFMYMEDMELCYRLRKAGYTTWFFSGSFVKHKEQGSSNRTFAILQIYKGLLYFYKKHKPFWQYEIVKLLLKLKAGVLWIVGTIMHNTYLTQTYGKAFALYR